MKTPGWTLRYSSNGTGNAGTRATDDSSGMHAVLIADEAGHKDWQRPGDRLHHLFSETVAQQADSGKAHAVALEYPDCSYTFAAVEQHSIRLARYLSRHGVSSGERVGVLLDRTAFAVPAMLALSRLGCTFVPLDADFPIDRIEYMLGDCSATRVLILGEYRQLLADLPVTLVALDEIDEEVRRESSDPLMLEAGDTDAICYVIYTSGTTGRPKGVPILHSSICNFIRVAGYSYGYEPDHRVYQGMTLAFDFSVEELWVPLIVGATIVPNNRNTRLLGPDLSDFIRRRNINALCCVPTLLATLDPDLHLLRFIMVSGETCPPALAVRWARPGRRFLNTYGPTEATVSATWQVIDTTGTVTIGGPLPSYSILVLDPEEPRVLPPGEVGEIAIAGIGLSPGYLNLPEKTSAVFIDDFIGIDNNPGKRIYRTGDLGRIGQNNTINCLGRVDTQVKIRGYRIELDEIESIVMETCSVAQAVVRVFESATGYKELALFLTAASPDKAIDLDAVGQRLRERVPAYMVPSYVDELAHLPRLPSGKINRALLPQPSGQRLISSSAPFVAPAPGLQTQLADWLSVELGLDAISADAHFFNDLGADSLLMTRYVLNISTQLPLVRVSIDQLYRNPSVIQLAESIERQTTRNDNSNETHWLNDVVESHPGSPAFVPPWQHWACGSAQLAVLLAGSFVFIYLNSVFLLWIDTASSVPSMFGRAFLSGCVVLFGWSAALIALKWIVVGRFREESFPIWSYRYFRFWVARAAIRSNPLNLTRGTWIYSLFLRLLGAQIGRHCHIHAAAPICADLISIGDQSLVRENVSLSGYTSLKGRMHCGPVSIGARAYIGPASVLDIATAVGDDAQLGMTSALDPAQSVPAGRRFHGSPAVETETNHDRVPPLPVRQWQRIADGLGGQLFLVLVFGYPLATVLAAWTLELEGSILPAQYMPSPIASGVVAVTAFLLIVSLFTYAGSMLLQLLRVLLIPRLLHPFMITGVAHPVFSFQYQLARAMNLSGNSSWLCRLFGDSSLILHYLRAIGYDMREATQTGSNCGVEIAQNSPFLCKFRRNTLASDGLTLMNMDLSYSSFMVKPIIIPENTYLGNAIHYPTDAMLGSNCLIATKAMIPVDGQIRSDTGILGSPPFEIPRSVARDRQFNHYKSADILPERLRLKLRSNLRTIGLYMFKSWSLNFILLVVALAAAIITALLPQGAFGLAIAGTVFIAISLLVTICYSILFEHIAQSFKPLKPRCCSLYEQEFWDHERFWKLSFNADPVMEVFNGTPIKPFLQKLRGLKTGRQTFDDGCSFPEPTLVELGEGCNLNAMSIVQAHSLEDGTFKSDRVRIGNHCSLGTGAFVHYGCDIQDDAVLLCDSFLIKGSTMLQGSVWGGNPAGDLSARSPDRVVIEPLIRPSDPSLGIDLIDQERVV